MPRKRKPTTVGALRKSRYKVLSVKQEMRKNLIRTLKNGAELFPGIIGFEDSVIPHLENALLAGQDIILLGERGQAKSRLIRHLVSLLDEEIPFIAGCELNDNPYAPICRACKEKLAADGVDVEIDWLPREDSHILICTCNQPFVRAKVVPIVVSKGGAYATAKTDVWVR